MCGLGVGTRNASAASLPLCSLKSGGHPSVAAEKRDAVRGAQDTAYRFMAATLGNEPNFEEAIRALYRGDQARFSAATEGWPPDLREHSGRLAAEAFRVLTPSPHTSASERR